MSPNHSEYRPCLFATGIFVSVVAKTKITLLWNEIKIRHFYREIVNKSIFLITRNKDLLNVNHE